MMVRVDINLNLSYWCVEGYASTLPVCVVDRLHIPSVIMVHSLLSECPVWSVLASKEDWAVACDVLPGHRQGGGAIQCDTEGPAGWRGHEPVYLSHRVIR